MKPLSFEQTRQSFLIAKKILKREVDFDWSTNVNKAKSLII